MVDRERERPQIVSSVGLADLSIENLKNLQGVISRSRDMELKITEFNGERFSVEVVIKWHWGSGERTLAMDPGEGRLAVFMPLDALRQIIAVV